MSCVHDKLVASIIIREVREFREFREILGIGEVYQAVVIKLERKKRSGGGGGGGRVNERREDGFIPRTW